MAAQMTDLIRSLRELAAHLCTTASSTKSELSPHETFRGDNLPQIEPSTNRQVIPDQTDLGKPD